MNGLWAVIRRLTVLASVAVALTCAAAAPAQAEEIQPATSACVIQGEGISCTLEEGSGSSQTGTEQSAVSWAQAQIGSTAWDGECLRFVDEAYAQAGDDITAQAGGHSSAIEYWDTYYGQKNAPSETPPYGALVFWNATATNPYGHVAISLGNGNAVSSEERTNVGIHEFSIAERDSQGYEQVGWVLPG